MKTILASIVVIVGLPLLAFSIYWSLSFFPAKLLEGERATQIGAIEFDGGTLYVLQHARELIISTYVRAEFVDGTSNTFIIDGDDRKRNDVSLELDSLSSTISVAFGGRIAGFYLPKQGVFKRLTARGQAAEQVPWETLATTDYPVPHALTHFDKRAPKKRAE